MQQEEIHVTIDCEGRILLEVSGVKGAGCTGLTKFLEEALGEVEDRDLKPDYYEEALRLSDEDTLSNEL